MLSHSYRLRRRSRHFFSLPLNVDRITQQTINGLALLSRKTGKMPEQNVLRRIPLKVRAIREKIIYLKSTHSTVTS